MAIIIDGKALAAKCKEEVRTAVAAMERKPGLAVILVGENPASQVYVRNKQKDCQECYLFEKRDMKYCFDNMTRFAKMILEKYGENIILLKTEPKDSYIDLDNRLRRLEDDGMYEIKKKFISLCEERFASVTGCYVIDISKHFYASDSFPLGGAHIVHYEEEFYRQAGEYINEIISGSSRHVFSTVDDNYLLLRNLRLNR